MKAFAKTIRRYTTRLPVVAAVVFLQFIAQCGHCQNRTIEKYIAAGLSNNLNIQQQKQTLDQALSHLAIAKGMFYPTISLESDYTYASGGRTFVLPIGDMLNPAYNALNNLTATNDFGSVPNQEFNLSANDYYDNRVSATLYLVNAELLYTKASKKEIITQRQAELAVYKRTLVRDIKVAYFNIASAQHQVTVYKNLDQMLRDNLEISKSHIRNGKSLPGDSLRILSDINNNKANVAHAEAKLATANAYLNFLVNAPLKTEVAIDTAGLRNGARFTQEDSLLERCEREEIAALKSVKYQAELTIKMRRSAYLPVISTYFSTGYQSTHFIVNKNTDYVLGGFTMRWNLFAGFQNRNKINVARADVRIAENKIEQAVQQYDYLRVSAGNELKGAMAQLAAHEENLLYLEEYYRTVKSRYNQGMALLAELNDAFTKFANARLDYENSLNNVWIKKAELERNTVSYPINQ